MRTRVANAAGGTLKAEWDYNVAAEESVPALPVLAKTHIAIVKFELPLAIQVEPILTLKLRLGVLRARGER